MNPAPRGYAVYLFDVGGTLITFDEGRRAARYAELAARVGRDVSAQEAHRILERLNEELPARLQHVQLSLLPEAEQRAFWVAFWAEGFREMGVRDADAVRFAKELLDPVNGGDFQMVYPDTVPALTALKARGKRVGVVSNFSPNCESLLAKLGIASFFDLFVISGILGIEKPDPRIFEHAVRAAGRPVNEIVYIGDSIFHDIEGAHGVGMDAILIDRADRWADFEGTRIRDLREL